MAHMIVNKQPAPIPKEELWQSWASEVIAKASCANIYFDSKNQPPPRYGVWELIGPGLCRRGPW